VALELPSLRERGGDDIEQLARHFLRLYVRRHDRPARDIDPKALDLLRGYSWPGNIRELEHSIESAVVFCSGPVLKPSHLSLPFESDESFEWDQAATEGSLPVGLPLADVEKKYILKTLAECGGNRTRAAAILGIGRNTLLRKLKTYGIA
jgi:Nif-specific regulatory protein